MYTIPVTSLLCAEKFDPDYMLYQFLVSVQLLTVKIWNGTDLSWYSHCFAVVGLFTRLEWSARLKFIHIFLPALDNFQFNISFHNSKCVLWLFIFPSCLMILQRGLDALPGMAILSACLEAVSEFHCHYYDKIMIFTCSLNLVGLILNIGLNWSCNHSNIWDDKTCYDKTELCLVIVW